MNDGLQQPDTEGTGRRACLTSPGCGSAVAAAVGRGVALAGCGRLSLRCSRVGSDVSVRRGAAEQLPVHVRAAGRAAAGALLGAEIVDEPSEAEDLDGERAEHHEEQRKSEPPVVAAEVIVDRKPNIGAHISEIHRHCGEDPQTVPHRVFLLLPAEAQARRSGATATRLAVDEVRLSCSRIRLRSRSEPLNRTRVIRILQRRECYIALLHL